MRLACFLLFSLFITACLKDTEQSEFVNIGQAFSVDLTQGLAEEGSHPVLYLQTTTIIECNEANILVEINEGDPFNIKIIDVVTPEECLDGFTYADQDILLPNEIGQYNLQLEINQIVKNEGTLVVENDGYFIEWKSEDGIQVLNSTLNRLRDNLIWGYIFRDSGNSDILLNELKVRLNNAVSASINLDPGNYGVFEYLTPQSPSIRIKGAPDSENTASFIWNKEGMTEEILNVINAFRIENPELFLYVQESSGLTY